MFLLEKRKGKNRALILLPGTNNDGDKKREIIDNINTQSNLLLFSPLVLLTTMSDGVKLL